MDYYVCIIFTLLITWGAQLYLKNQYNQCVKLNSKKGMSGADVAREILEKNGISDVDVVETSGTLSDHYDPKSKVVRLSPTIYRQSSIASISVAAHECGHAIQDKKGYVFLRIRRSFVPLVNLASQAGYIAIMIGIFAGILKLVWLGILFEMFILLFQLVTLPVEFNASHRGLKQLSELGIIADDERSSCKGMLNAAALTYVAGVATAVIEILRLISIANNRRK